ncbi:MAG: hypothetical protein ACJ763_06095 [Bdellovibrionia bacterium]
MNPTFKTILLSSLVVLLSKNASAVHGVGNGGNVIVCKDSSSAIRSVEILDYYELRQAGGKLRLNPALGSYSAMLQELFQSWKSVAPKRMAQYEKWLSEFEKDSAIYSGVQIPPIEDTGVINIPVGCGITPAAFQRPESQLLPGIKRYTINKDLWDRMSEIEKAGLVLHELIYREGIRAGHPSSFATRYFNGYLASATPQPMEYALVVQQLPLEWVEFGQGLVINLGTAYATQGDVVFQRTSKITEEGWIAGKDYDPAKYVYPFSNYQKGTYSEFSGDVNSEHLKIRFKSLSHEATNKSGQIEVSHEKLVLTNLVYTRVASLMASLDGLQMEFTALPTQLTGIQMINQNKHLEFGMRSSDAHPAALAVNPGSSFYVQADGSRIESITQILPSRRPNFNEAEYAYYGDGFVTSTGETWIYDSKLSKYVKK